MVTAKGSIPLYEFDRGGHGLADHAFSLRPWWQRGGRSTHSHFYRGGRGVSDTDNLTSIVVAAEWPIPHSHVYRDDHVGPIPRSLFWQGGCGMVDTRLPESTGVAGEEPIPTISRLS